MRRPRKDLAIVAVTTTLFVTIGVLVAPVALGDAKEVRDAADVAEGPLDLASASHGHGSTQATLVHRIEAHDPWTNGAFVGARIQIWLPDRDRRHDRILTIFKNPDGSLAAAMVSLDHRSTPLRGYANVYRSSDRSLEVVIPKRLIASKLRSYVWKVYLAYDHCPEEGDDGTCSGYDTHTERVQHVISR